MSRCDEARQFLLVHLESDIAAHERGDFEGIGSAEQFCPSFDGCRQENEAEGERLLVAWNFWDQWIDARNHNWQHYPGVGCDDWPIIARQICQGLRECWDADRMRDNFVFNPPPKPPKVSLWTRLFSTQKSP